MKKGSKPALQRRSRQTRDSIVDALERLLREKDFAEISVGDLAEEAGVSPGAIYRRFEGGLVPVLLELSRVTVERRAASPAAQLDVEKIPNLREALRQVARIAWEQMRAHPHVYRAAFLHARLRPELVGEQRTDLEGQVFGGIRAILDAYRNEVGHTDLDRAAAMVAYVLNTMLVEHALFDDATPRWKALPRRASFADEMAAVAYAYLASPKT